MRLETPLQEEDFYIGNEPKDTLGILSVQVGLDNDLIDQLVHYANTDDVIREFTSDATRYSSKDAYHHWLKKGRTVYCMLNTDNKLLGLVFFGQSDFPENTNFLKNISLSTDMFSLTYATRMYDEARGQHLARKLTAAALSSYLASPEYHQIGGGIWLLVSQNNLPAVNTYEHFGFKTVSEPDTQGKIIMVLGLKQ